MERKTLQFSLFIILSFLPMFRARILPIPSNLLAQDKVPNEQTGATNSEKQPLFDPVKQRNESGDNLIKPDDDTQTAIPITNTRRADELVKDMLAASSKLFRDSDNDLNVISTSASLGKEYWVERCYQLYENIFRDILRSGELHGEDKEERRFLRHAVKIVLKEIRRVLRELHVDELIRLFWMIIDAWMNGDITDDGKIIINGEVYDLDDLLAHCCPFG